MRIIEKLSDMISEELNDAEKYIKCAMTEREEHPELASVFSKISAQEMDHVAMLHEQVTILINAYRREHGEPPEKMQGVYDYLHKKHIEHGNEIKILQGLFKA